MQVGVRLALNLWDIGGQHGQESEEGEGKEEEGREEEVGFAATSAETHQGACALPSRSQYCRGLMWFSDATNPSRTMVRVSADGSGFFVERRPVCRADLCSPSRGEQPKEHSS